MKPDVCAESCSHFYCRQEKRPAWITAAKNLGWTIVLGAFLLLVIIGIATPFVTIGMIVWGVLSGGPPSLGYPDPAFLAARPDTDNGAVAGIVALLLVGFMYLLHVTGLGGDK